MARSHLAFVQFAVIHLMMRRTREVQNCLIDYLASAVGWWTAPAYAKEHPPKRLRNHAICCLVWHLTSDGEGIR
jgi:hypothetical protein